MDTVPLSNDPKYYVIDLLARASCMQLSIPKRITLQYYKFECVFCFIMLNCCPHGYSTRSTHGQVPNTWVSDFLGGRKQEVVLKRQESHGPNRSPELILYKSKSIFSLDILIFMIISPFSYRMIL